MRISLRVVFTVAAVCLVLLGVAVQAAESPTSSHGMTADEVPDAHRDARHGSVLLLETTDTSGSVQLALNNLGIAFDLVNTSDWIGVDFSPYETVIAAMDGGSVSDASVQRFREEVIDTGKRGMFLGGTYYTAFANGVDTHLLGIDTSNYGWAVSATPHLTVTVPVHFLTRGLPSTYDYVNVSAAYYMARLTDGMTTSVAVNGDGHSVLFHKQAGFPGGGGGNFTWFTSSPKTAYWADAGDFAVLEQIIANVFVNPVLLLQTTDTTGSVQAALTNLGIAFDLIQATDWTTVDFSPYESVVAAMDGGSISGASVQRFREEVIDTGKRGVFLGGTAHEPFAIGVNTHLMGVDPASYYWTVSTTPHLIVTEPGHHLAQGVPSPYDYVDPSAAYYMARITDPETTVVAVNGDGHPSLIEKHSAFYGSAFGNFVWFTYSPYTDYWTDPGDFAVLERVLANAFSPPVLVLDTTSSGTVESVQQALNNLGVGFHLLFTDDWSAVNFSPYRTVIAAMNGGFMVEADIQRFREEVIDAGKKGIFLGGSNWSPFVLGVDAYLLAIDTGTHGWTSTSSPNLTVTAPAHPLAWDVPSPYDYVDSWLTYYMARLVDPQTSVVAVNGDGHPALVYKNSGFPGGGTGDFSWYTTPPSGYFWLNNTDHAVLQQILANDLALIFTDGFEIGSSSAWSFAVP